MSERVEILWAYYCPYRKQNVEEWILGTLLSRRPDGTCEVRADNGYYAEDAAPECVRIVTAMYQPRWVCWMRVRPVGAGNAAFMAWIQRMWAEWDALNGGEKNRSEKAHLAFDAWLDVKTKTAGAQQDLFAEAKAS